MSLNIDWTHIPERFKYVALDADGILCAFEQKPIPVDEDWQAVQGEYSVLLHVVCVKDWENEIYVRPVTEH
jgi:hypothetical protein